MCLVTLGRAVAHAMSNGEMMTHLRCTRTNIVRHHERCNVQNADATILMLTCASEWGVFSPWARTPPGCRSRSGCPASGPCRLWTAEWRERGKQRAKTKPSNNETHTRKEGGWKRKGGGREENRVSGFSSQESRRRETVSRWKKSIRPNFLKPLQSELDDYTLKDFQNVKRRVVRFKNVCICEYKQSGLGQLPHLMVTMCIIALFLTLMSLFILMHQDCEITFILLYIYFGHLCFYIYYFYFCF